MNKEQKNIEISLLDKQIQDNKNFYLADISGLSAEQTSNLRRLCFKRNISLKVVKNTLLKKALDTNNSDFLKIYEVLRGNTSIMFSNSSSLPAKVIKEFRKKHDRPILKAAHIDDDFYIGDEHLAELASLKSKEELISDILSLLKSPITSVISSLNSGKRNISEVLKSLEKNKK